MSYDRNTKRSEREKEKESDLKSRRDIDTTSQMCENKTNESKMCVKRKRAMVVVKKKANMNRVIQSRMKMNV